MDGSGSPDRVARDRPQDLRAGPERARERARDLRATRRAPPVVDRDLDDAEPATERLHLHLDGPAVVAVVHLERSQRVPADRAERAEVGEAVAVERADHE